MPKYRIYYTERKLKDSSARPGLVEEYLRLLTGDEHVSQTEWEEEVEAKNAQAALEAFFDEHVPERSMVHIVEEDGRDYPIKGVGDFDPNRTYVWLEDGAFLYFDGMDEVKHGMTTCPLCEGAGEVDEEVADEFLEEWGEEEEEEGDDGVTWG